MGVADRDRRQKAGTGVGFARGGQSGGGPRSRLLPPVTIRKEVRIHKDSSKLVRLAQQTVQRAKSIDPQVLVLPQDPITARIKAAVQTKKAKVVSFRQVVDDFLKSNIEVKTEGGNKKHLAQWRSTLETYAVAVIGKRPIDEVNVKDVFEVLGPIWNEKAETASRVRQRIERVLDWAGAMDLRSGENPASLNGKLQHLLPKKATKAEAEEHHPAVSLKDAPRWWAQLQGMEGQGARALRLAVLCASRSGEVRGLTWGEVEFGKSGPERITFPAKRMKAKVPHLVPLSSAAVEVLRQAAGLRGGEDWPEMPPSALVFPAARGGALSDMTLSATMRRMQEAEEAQKRLGYLDSHSARPAVPHGCRSTFRDWAGSVGQPRDLAEEALAHAVGNAVEAAYARTQRVEQRRPMMEAWAAFLAGPAPQPGQSEPVADQEDATAGEAKGAEEQNGSVAEAIVKTLNSEFGEAAVEMVQDYLAPFEPVFRLAPDDVPQDVKDSAETAKRKRDAGARPLGQWLADPNRLTGPRPLSLWDERWITYSEKVRTKDKSPISAQSLQNRLQGVLKHFAIEMLSEEAKASGGKRTPKSRADYKTRHTKTHEGSFLHLVATLQKLKGERDGSEGGRQLTTDEGFDSKRKDAKRAFPYEGRGTEGDDTPGIGDQQPDLREETLRHLSIWLGRRKGGAEAAEEREKLVALLVDLGSELR